jgi:hypothetical protein
MREREKINLSIEYLLLWENSMHRTFSSLRGQWWRGTGRQL